MDDEQLYCKECGFPVEPIRDAKVIIGAGREIPGWKHRYLTDPTGVPYCGRTALTGDDVEPSEETEV